MKWIVQKIPSRDVSNIVREIPELIIVEDQKREPMKTFIRSMEAAGLSPHVHFEDDIDLTKGFRQKILIAINQYPDKMISFFTLKKRNSISIEPGRNFCMLQCVYFPSGMANDIVNFHKIGWKREQEHPDAFDYMVADYLDESKQTYVLWNPSLVQHKVIESSLDKRRSKYRQSKSYVE